MIPRCCCSARHVRASPSSVRRSGLQNSDRIGTRASTSSSFQRRHRQRLRTTDALDELVEKQPDAVAQPAKPFTAAYFPTHDLPKTEEDERIQKARFVFGSRLAGPKERRRELDKASIRIAGILVPPRPEEPDNCCMSGCVNCVWDRFRDELEEWAGKSAEARQALQAQRQRGDAAKPQAPDALGRTAGQSDMPSHVANSMDDDGGGSEALWQSPSDKTDLFAEIPVGIREFMKQEKRLKQKKLKAKQKQAAVAE